MKNKTLKHKKMCKHDCEHETTMVALNHWFNRMFEELGWMILAKHDKHMEYKVISYKKSLHRLKDSLECKIRKVEEIDRKNDLMIMSKHLHVLMSKVNKVL
jgi:hypothetical protein